MTADPRSFRRPPTTRAAIAALCLLTAALAWPAPAQPASAPAATAPSTAPATKAGGAAAAPAMRQARPIRVHGNDQRFWIVQVYGVSGEKGMRDEALVYRRASGEDRWSLVGKLDSDVVALGSRVTQLAMLVPDGSWLLLSDETATTGPPLPNGAKLVTFGADGGTLWAIGELPPAAATAPAARAGTTLPSTAPAAASRPSTAPADAATRPAAGASLALYSLQSYGWVRGADLPAASEGSAAVLSLSFVDHEPIVAWRAAPTSAEVWRFTDGIWFPVGEVATQEDIVRVKLIGGTPRPVLWVAAGARESVLTWLGRDDQRKRVELPVAPDARAEDHAVAFANGRVRVVGYVDGKLTERAYDPLTGADSGEPSPLTLPKPANTAISRWVEPAITIALIYVIVASVRRRQQMRDAALNPADFVLAPVGRRLLAGTIDALPVLAGGAIAWWQYSRGGDAPLAGSWIAVLENMAPAQAAIYGGGCVVYLLHTALGEALAGRSLGKACCGLRVVGLDGKRPAVGAVVIRNLLRIIDLTFFPLVLILFSPLRQRAGDVAAGTLVVMNGQTQRVAPGADADADADAAGDDGADVAGRSSSQSDT